ncbi:MAG: DUF4013 domain-containing protein [Candidatus Obscuribacterales bacterium]|nr:DUF4013 domain-containing protein [Candidatus Obscuribacterales bacterium]
MNLRPSSKNVDVERLLRAVLKDEWMLKTGVGGILAATGIVAILYSFICLPLSAACVALMIGYCLRCMRVKAANPEAKLPDWNEWGDLFLSGITWIALQFGIWVFVLSLQMILMGLAVSCAYTSSSEFLTILWLVRACVTVSASLRFLFVLCAYTMVNFAIEENAKAGLAFAKVAQRLAANPGKLLLGFALAMGIQIAAVLIPCLTLVGVFLVPSAYFAGQMVSAIVLARFWCSCRDEE